MVIGRLNGPYVLCQQGDATKVPPELKGDCFRPTVNTGHNLSDYLKFIIDNYENLPEELGFIKGNVFPRHIEESIFIERIKSRGFIPLYGERKTYIEQRHRLFRFLFVGQQIAPGYYLEITNDWYISKKKPGRYFPTLRSMFEKFIKQPLPKYILFVPGACMVVPRDNILRWPLDVYKELHESVTYEFFPVEAYHLERCMLYFFCFPTI